MRATCICCGNLRDSEDFCAVCADASALAQFRNDVLRLNKKADTLSKKLDAVRVWLEPRLAAAPEHKGLLELKEILK